LFSGKGENEKKFICSIFAGLLSSQDNHLIQVILEQLGQLTEEEKKDLKNILERTTLSNVVRTIKEVDHRLEVLKTLKELIADYTKQTLENNIQRILDENFWIFGEQFRLFSTTEGSLKNTLLKYAKEILEIENPSLSTEPKGEVDLFLTKTEESNDIQKNIIVELKRPYIKLSEEKEYLQLKKYCNKITKEPLCNGANQYWEFYLIGTNYDKTIEDLIKSQGAEKQKGLVYAPEERIKIYVRKWSDILEVEWGNKMKFLKEKLEIQSKSEKYLSPNDLTNSVIDRKIEAGTSKPQKK